jgi:hypothetical protein
LAGCPIILACRNRDFGTPAASHALRIVGVIEMATATPARRLPNGFATRLYCNLLPSVRELGGNGVSHELQIGSAASVG